MAKGKALPPFPRICCALSLSLFRCVLFLFMTSDDKKHERRKCCCEGRENFIFFTRFARRIKSRRRDRNGSDFLGPAFFAKKKERQKRDRIFFKTKASFFPFHLLLIIISTLLWCLSTTFRRPQRKFLRVLLSKNTEREREREVLIFLFLKRRREL